VRRRTKRTEKKANPERDLAKRSVKHKSTRKGSFAKKSNEKGLKNETQREGLPLGDTRVENGLDKKEP